jgi:hypothetical protein
MHTVQVVRYLAPALVLGLIIAALWVAANASSPVVMY